MITKKDIVDYQISSGKQLQNIKTAFEKFNLKEAIEKAAKSIDPTNNNKMFSHQRRVGFKVANNGFELLKEREDDLRRCESFEEILSITDEISKQIYRLGLLWSYDTALRIGFHLKIYPSDVYIQAGVVKGYVKLFNKKPKARKIHKNEFPMFAELEAYEVENFLCIWGGEKWNLQEY